MRFSGYKKFAIVALNIFSSIWVDAQDYYVYVTAESEDEVAVVKFDGQKATTVKRIPVGVWPAEIEGPHGITVDPEGKYWYLSMAHGNPYGTLYKYETGSDQLAGQTTLGLFPATMQISPATGLLYCVNFNLHGDMEPSTVSVVDPETMTELKQITTGVMPHGSRISPDGMKHYSVAMMSGELFEIDALDLKVLRTLNLDAGPSMSGQMGHDQHHDMDHSKMDHARMPHSKVKPTWVIPHPQWRKVYVAGNGSDEILEVDLDQWAITRRFSGDKGPYNVEITPDGKKLVVTYKTAARTGVWDLQTGKELARLDNNRRVSHGIALSPDSKYAFVSVEGVGGEPGSVDVIGLNDLKVIDTAELGKQAGGIYFWKLED